MRKFIPLLILACSVIVGSNTLVFGAEQIHPRNPKLESALSERSSLLAPVAEPSSERLLPPASEEKKLEQNEQLCSRETDAAVDCSPQPGSTISAFPLVSYPNSSSKENLP